jgi:molecular chaperone HscB
VQNRVHPDKFAHAGDAEKRVAMQWATRANEAYQTLRSPFKRAAYLCELNGIDLQTESNTAMPTAFLMQQMEWREELEEAKAEKDIDALTKLESELRRERNEELEKIGALLDEKKFEQAGQGVRQLMFLEKFAQEIAHTFEAIHD